MTDRVPSETLARKFHEIYERLAPQFGYETRKETRAFDPNTPNGKLMIAVCEELREREAVPIGYAVQMDTGHFVGIWRDCNLAEAVCDKQPATHHDRVVPVYARPPSPDAQAGKMREVIWKLAIELKASCDREDLMTDEAAEALREASAYIAAAPESEGKP